jgi:ribonuclease BN (tRNA processing enzyme)
MATVTFLGVEGYPMRGRQTIGVLISSGANHLILDCGASIVQQLDNAGVRVSDVGCVFVSHIHADHSSGVPLMFFGNVMERFFGLTSSKGTLRVIGIESVLNPLLAYCKTAYPLLWNENPMLHIDESRCATDAPTNFDLGWCKLTTFPTSHALPSVGCSVTVDDRKISFTSDSRRTSDIDSAVGGSDLLICSILGPNSEAAASQKFGFMTPRDAGELAQATGTRQLALVHIADTAQRPICHSEASVVFHGNVLTPANGDKLVID